jgi:hypothetical protein
MMSNVRMARGAGDIRLRTGVVLAAAVVIFGTDALVSATDLPFALLRDVR